MELPVAEQDSILASKLEYEELMQKGGKLAAESCFRCDEVSVANCQCCVPFDQRGLVLRRHSVS